MKTTKWVISTLALLIAAISFATETPKMNVVASEDDKILVSFESTTAYPVELIITDADGEIMHYWKSDYPENIVNQRLNLSQLGHGKFNVALNYGGTSINREISITRKEIKVGEPLELHEPFFSFKNEKLNVSFLNIANRNVYLNVYKDGEYYDGLTLGKDVDIQKSIDFSIAGKGTYEVVLRDYFKDHYYSIRK
jgi:hypothetical protein